MTVWHRTSERNAARQRRENQWWTSTARYFMLIWVMLSASLCKAGDGMHVVDYDGQTITGRLRDSARSPFVITVRTAPYTKALGSSVESWVGNEGDPPHFAVLTELSFSIAGISIAIPHEAFADLADPHVPYGVYVMQSPEFVYLYVSGSDGAGSYDARFTFKNMRLIERRIMGGESDEFEPPSDSDIKKF